MPRCRWVIYEGRQWRLTELAAAHHLLPQTLASRIDRGLPIPRALATGLLSMAEAGRRGAAVSPWRALSACTGA